METDTPTSWTFEEKVNTILSEAKPGADGKLELPDDLDEATRFAVITEKRRRDTQATFTKNQQRLKQLESENEETLTRWEKAAIANLSSSKQEELEALKHSDPDAWRVKLDELENEARSKFEEEHTQVKTAATTKSEIELRAEALAQFQESNPDIILDDDVIENDIPPRFTKQLEEGKISFEEFLDKCRAFLTGEKVIEPGATVRSKPRLHDLGRSANPDDRAVDKAAKASYGDEIY